MYRSSSERGEGHPGADSCAKGTCNIKRHREKNNRKQGPGQILVHSVIIHHSQKTETLTKEWINKMSYAHAMAYYVALKRKF